MSSARNSLLPVQLVLYIVSPPCLDEASMLQFFFSLEKEDFYSGIVYTGLSRDAEMS
jgi:hypothetical protein